MTWQPGSEYSKANSSWHASREPSSMHPLHRRSLTVSDLLAVRMQQLCQRDAARSPSARISKTLHSRASVVHCPQASLHRDTSSPFSDRTGSRRLRSACRMDEILHRFSSRTASDYSSLSRDCECRSSPVRSCGSRLSRCKMTDRIDQCARQNHQDPANRPVCSHFAQSNAVPRQARAKSRTEQSTSLA